MMPQETKTTTETPLPLPSEGGSYERQSDGSLKRKPDDETPAPEAPSKRKKEA